jgi:hypothetical protein
MMNSKFKSREIIYQLLLISIIIFLYSFSWHYPIYGGWDDVRYILRNQNLSFSFSNVWYWFTHPCVGCYLPVTMLSYMFDYSLWGLSSFGYHLQNIFWHIIAVIAVYKCFKLFNIKSWIAFFLCLIFAIHPQRIESVVWLSERKDVLCAAFYFLCIYFYIKNHDKKFSITAFIFFILSMLSKSMAISLPVILLIYEFYRYGKERWKTIDYRLETLGRGQCPENGEQRAEVRKQRKNAKPTCLIDLIRLLGRSLGTKPGSLTRLWPYFVALAIFIPIAIGAQGKSFNSNSHILSYHGYYRVIFNLFWYFKQTVLPNELNPIYPLISISGTVFRLAVFYITVIIMFTIIYLKSKTVFLYCVLPILFCYLFSMLPVSGFFLLGGTDHADRYSYISSVFVWFSVGLILTRLLCSKKNMSSQLKKSFPLIRKFVFAILLLYSVILIKLNYQYQKIWHSHYSVFYYAANSVSANPVALYYLAELELALGNYDNVIKLTKQLEHKNKNSLPALYLKATVKYYSGNKADASELLIRLLPLYRAEANKKHEINSSYFKVLNMLIDCSCFTGNTKNAIKYIDETLQFKKLSKAKRLLYLKLKKELILDIDRKNKPLIDSNER